MKKSVFLFAFAFSTYTQAATFDFCTCQAYGDSAAARAYVMGKTFVKASDGSVSIQETVLDQKTFDGNNYWSKAIEKAMAMCENSKKILIKQNICPAE